VFAIAVAVALAADGQAIVVVVIRAVLLPAAVVPVVKIPADGFFLRVSGGDKVELPAAAADWADAERFDAAVLRVVDEGRGIASVWGIGEFQQRRDKLPQVSVSQANPESVLGGCDWLQRRAVTAADTVELNHSSGYGGIKSQPLSM
jgi:hypothetical protein